MSKRTPLSSRVGKVGPEPSPNKQTALRANKQTDKPAKLATKLTLYYDRDAQEFDPATTVTAEVQQLIAWVRKHIKLQPGFNANTKTRKRA